MTTALDRNYGIQNLLSRQRGVSLLVSLIVMVIMTIAGIAMMRQMGLGLSVAGNLAFKQNATSAADLGTETAFTYLTAPAQTTSALSYDIAPQYYAEWDPAFDADPLNWNGWAAIPTIDDGHGNQVQYVIHRLCRTGGGMLPSNPAQQCSNLRSVSGNSQGGLLGYAAPPPPYIAPYFRITTRVQGPRNTLSLTQVLVIN